MTAVLKGICVVELGTMITAPLAGQMLADLGAEVIKVEHPQGGDPFRSFRGGLYSPHFLAYKVQPDDTALAAFGAFWRTLAATLAGDFAPAAAALGFEPIHGEIVSGHLRGGQQKLRNVRRDPRVALSIEGTIVQPPGLKQYLVVHGRARLEEGGAPELLQRLARTYLGPDVEFPPMDDPPAGYVMRIAVERIGGVGPWQAPA